MAVDVEAKDSHRGAQVAPVVPADYDDLARFLAEFQDEERRPPFWRRRFQLWWEDNPAFSDDVPRGWLLRDAGHIVGFFGVIPSKFQFAGDELIVLNTTTWRVLPEYRNQSLSLLLKLMSVSKNRIIFWITPIPQVAQIIESIKFQSLAFKDHLLPNHKIKKSVIIVNFERYVQSKLVTRFGTGCHTTLASWSLAQGLKVLQKIRFRSVVQTKLQYVVDVQKADQAFDQLWRDTKAYYPNTVVRTSEMINWYCFQNDALEKKVFGFYQDHQLRGFVIYWPRPSRRLKILECVDLWVHQDHTHGIRALLDFSRIYAQEHGFDLIVLPHFSDDIEASFKNMRLLQTQFNARKQYVKVGAELRPALTRDHSYFVDFLGDHGL